MDWVALPALCGAFCHTARQAIVHCIV